MYRDSPVRENSTCAELELGLELGAQESSPVPSNLRIRGQGLGHLQVRAKPAPEFGLRSPSPFVSTLNPKLNNSFIYHFNVCDIGMAWAHFIDKETEVRKME